MAGSSETVGAGASSLPPRTVRVLRGEEELEAAVARAAEGARRLHDRLAARAARDAWMVEHDEQRVAWLRFVKGEADRSPLITALSAGGEVRPALGRQSVSGHGGTGASNSSAA